MKKKFVLCALVLFCFISISSFGQSLGQRVQQAERTYQQQRNQRIFKIVGISVGIITGIIILGIIITVAVSNKTWTYNYNGNTIVVKNTTSTGELYINGQLHDKKTAALSSQMSLQSKLDSGEEVLVHLGSGMVSVDCNVKVNGKLIYPT